MEIRLGIKKDSEEITQYLKEIWLIHSKEEPKFINKEKIEKYSSKIIKKYIKDCFDKKHKSYLLIAEENNKITGFLKIDIVKIQDFFIETKVLYLDDIYVKEEYRKKGISKKLIQEAEKIAKKRKIKWLKSRIYEFNKASQSMAKSSGLTPLYSEYFKIL